MKTRTNNIFKITLPNGFELITNNWKEWINDNCYDVDRHQFPGTQKELSEDLTSRIYTDGGDSIKIKILSFVEFMEVKA